jgi:polyhydroxyalkanoate synthesis regulator phasin
MAEWRKVAKAFALGDGHVSQDEVNVLREQLFADGKISKSEMDFLYEIKKEAKTSVKLLDELIADCEKAMK